MTTFFEVLGAGLIGGVISLATVSAAEAVRVLRDDVLKKKFNDLRHELGFVRAVEQYINWKSA
ncbi:MAG: hypothetical protein ACRD3J_31380 [Thermoanaerobaculia bacterium]